MRLNIVRLWRVRRPLAAAVEEFADRADREPGVPAHWYNLGATYYRMGQDGRARAAWLVRFGEATLPTASSVLQEGDQLVVAVTDEITGRLHDVVENAPEGRQH